MSSSRAPSLVCALAAPLALLAGAALDAPQEVEGTVALLGELPAGGAYTFLEELQEQAPERSWQAPVERRERALELIEDALEEALDDVEGANVRRERFPDPTFANRELINVLGRIPGRERGREVVLAAHHDTVPEAPGAIDDGGGVACLIVAAQALAARASAGEPPGCDVVLAVFDGEERGLLGAKAHLEGKSEQERARVQAAMAVELVGWRRDRLVVHTIPHGFAWQAPGAAPGWLLAEVQRAGAVAEVEVGVGDAYLWAFYQPSVRVLRLGTGSDAGAYAARGIPAVMLAGSSLTRFYSDYHQTSDDLTQVDAKNLDEAARAVTAAAWRLAARSAESSPRSLGELCFVHAGRVIGPWFLRAAGVLAALALLLAGLAELPLGRRLEGLAAVLAALPLLGLVVVGSLVGLLVGIPLACLIALAAPLPRLLRRWVAILGLAPALAEGAVIGAAGASFGLKWQAGQLETGLMAATLILGGVAAIRAGRARKDEVKLEE